MSSTIAEGFNEHVLELVDSDFSSWEAGDRLVIASTDFDFNQAEEVEVISVDGNKVTVRGNKKIMRFPKFKVYIVHFILS